MGFFFCLNLLLVASLVSSHGEVAPEQRCPPQVPELDECLGRLRVALDGCGTYTKKVEELRERMETINEGFQNINEADALFKYVPGIQSLVDAAKQKIQPVEASFTAAYKAVVAADEKVQGQECDAAVIDVDIMMATLETLHHDVCNTQRDQLDTKQKCLRQYTKNYFRVGVSLPDLLNFIEGEEGRSSGCQVIDSITNAVSQPPAIEDILTSLSSFQAELEPVLQLLFRIREGLNTQLCLLTPKAQDPKSESWWANWGIKDMWHSWFSSESESKSSIKKKYWNNVSNRRRFIQIGRGGKAVKDVCISVKDVQDGIKGPLSERAQQILDGAVSEIPAADSSIETPDFEEIGKIGQDMDSFIADNGPILKSEILPGLPECLKKAWMYCQEEKSQAEFSIKVNCSTSQ